jgi:hypothetical protein
MKKLLFVVILLIKVNAYAQEIICLKRDTTIDKNQTAIALAVISPEDKSASSGSIGFKAQGNKKLFSFVWTKGKYSHLKLDLENDIQILSVIIKFDDSSVITFTPGDGSRVVNKYSMHIEASITDSQIKAFLTHKIDKCILLVDPNIQYDLFSFDEKNKKDLQKAVECFLSNPN